ncbi:hypothetical protein ES703_72651 [subsurface metagenome]
MGWSPSQVIDLRAVGGVQGYGVLFSLEFLFLEGLPYLHHLPELGQLDDSLEDIGANYLLAFLDYLGGNDGGAP